LSRTLGVLLTSLTVVAKLTTLSVFLNHSNAVLVSGAGSGIGLATALRLAQQGFEVFASVPDLAQKPAVDAAAAEWNVALRVLYLDVTKPDSIQQAVELVLKTTGSIYGVVNSAGLGLRGFFEDLSDTEIRNLFDVNVFGVMALTRAVLPHMRAARRGRIVVIGSVGGRVASMSLSGYCAGKFALEGFVESLWQEVRPLGIHVSVIEPGLVMTPHFTTHRGRGVAATDPKSPYFAWFARHEQLADNILRAGRLTPGDIAATVHKALTASRPRLRYGVGKGARLVIGLRRFLPNRWFERLYFGHIVKLVTRPGPADIGLSQLSLPGDADHDYLGLRRPNG
jgi:NAD(P)-dependent dehydrogenase (short-subunit alcohol dehydrogenase family)